MQSNLQNLANSNDHGVAVHTGFPNPGIDQRGRGRPLALDINQLLVRHPSSTYLFRIKGHTWADQGVFDGDIAVIDRSATASSQDLVVSWEENGFNVQKRHHLPEGTEHLGVVTAIIHQYKYRDQGIGARD